MARPSYETVGDYIAAQPAAARPTLRRVRATIRAALPRATERISYQIPTYSIDGRVVLYFAAFKQHWSIYPASKSLLRALGDDLAARLHNRATVRFSYEEALPTRLVTRIAKLRAAEAAGGQPMRVARGAKKKKRARTVKKRRRAS